jgi:thiamine biosynthesis lipoprotein
MRTQHEIEVWGTVLYIDVTSAVNIEQAITKVNQYVQHVDEVFSTYKVSSVISQLRRSEITIDECEPDVIEVWNLCAYVKDLTDGAFDPWAVAGGFDPSGLVKGWAADKCAQILQAAGAEHIQVNAAGDLSLRGGFTPDKPWTIGVVNPDNHLEILQTFEIQDGAIATSGNYERGAHISDPHTGMIAIGAKSATVLGPNGAIADALATALMVDGRDGAAWFTTPELAEYSAWVIDRHEDLAWSIGPATA